jgi:uncharacterized protein (TIGR00255 family)
MLRSMTGFGKASVEAGQKKLSIEIRSLNSRGMDINLKVPSTFREWENDIRNLLSVSLVRGKVDLSITQESGETSELPVISKEAVRNYYDQMNLIATELGVSTKDSMHLYLAALKMPDTTKSAREHPTEEEWEALQNGLRQALDQVSDFRKLEGEKLEEDIDSRILLILDKLKQTSDFEKERIRKIRERIGKQLSESSLSQEPDKNRFEQELIYYLEKLDITEEKVRLKKHCEYFLETMKETESPGKKLGFIAQEIGREINTLGSKANDFEIQKLVVQMKDELEKIREQLMNVL